MISKSDYLSLVGLATLGIDKRIAANTIQNEIESKLLECGVSVDDADTWAGEIVYNEGDAAAAAVDRVLSILDVEVEAE